MKAIVSALQTNSAYNGIQKARTLGDRYGAFSKDGLPEKSYFANAKVFSSITGKDIPQPKGRVYRSED